MCSTVSELAARLVELRCPPLEVTGLREYLVGMAGVLETAQVSYVEAVACFEALKGARADGGQGSTKDWLTAEARRSPRQAAGDTRLARLLHGDGKRPLLATNAALAAGDLSFEQAKAIASALRALEPETVQQIEATLVSAVASAEPAAAAALCAHAVELATPASAVGRARVRARKRHLDFYPAGDMIGVSGLLSPADAELIATAIAPLARPRRRTKGGAQGVDVHGADWGADGADSRADNGSEADSECESEAADCVGGGDCGGGGQDQREAGQRRADALVELARRALNGGQLPVTGGTRPQLHVTIDVNDLITQPGSPESGPGVSANGRPVPGWEARMISCDADITGYLIRGRTGPGTVRTGPGSSRTGDTQAGNSRWHGLPDLGADVDAEFDVEFDLNADPEPVDPALLNRLLTQISPALGGTAPEILAYGRSVRIIPPALRKALILRDKGCAYPGCDKPPSWCDAHHNTRHWSDQGETNLKDTILACGHHHTVLHQTNQMLIPTHDGHWELAPYPPGGRSDCTEPALLARAG